MGTLKVNGDISATGSISASSFLGNASSASKWATARTIKIGKTGKSVDGSSNVSWTHYEIGVPYCYDTSPTGSPAYSHWGMLISREENKYGQSGTGDNYFIGVNSNSQLHIGHQLNGTSVITWTNILSEHNYSSYALPLSGGTIAATTTTNTPLSIKSGDVDAYIRFEDKNGTILGYYGVNANHQPVFYYDRDKILLHSENYSSYTLPLSGGTMTGSPVIKFPASAGSIATSDPMAITYGRISAYGTLCINANTDNSGTEYIILTAGKGLSSSTTDGLAIGTSTLTWQGSTVLTTGNFPSSSSLARQTDTWISAASLDVNTYYPVVIDIPYQGLCRIKLAVQLNSSTRPSWSTHNAGFTSNIDVEIIAAGWGTVSPYRYLLRQDDWNFSNVKPAYFAGQLGNASKAVFYVRGGGSYRFICDWQDASISLRTSSTTYNDQTVAPTTSTSIFHSGSKSHLYCNVDYASSAGNADTLDGSHASAFAAASHSHSYLPLSGGTMTGTITLAPMGLRTNQASGWYLDDYGNFYHTNTASNSYWNIFNNAGTKSLRYYYETGVLIAPRPATTNYGGTLPSSGVAGEIFYKI